MSRAETLAGLAEAIAEAADAWLESGGNFPGSSPEQWAAKAALAWLEGHGWAEGDVQDVHLPRIPHSTRTLRGVTTPVETGDAP